MTTDDTNPNTDLYREIETAKAEMFEAAQTAAAAHEAQDTAAADTAAEKVSDISKDLATAERALVTGDQPVSSADLYQKIENLKIDLSIAQREAAAALDAYNLELEAQVATGTEAEVSTTSLDAANGKITAISRTIAAAERAKAKAEEREKKAADEAARAELVPYFAKIEEAGRKIDDAMVILAANLNYLSLAKSESQGIIMRKMDKDAIGSGAVYGSASEASSSIARYFDKLMTGNPGDLDDFGARAANRLVARIKTAARMTEED